MNLIASYTHNLSLIFSRAAAPSKPTQNQKILNSRFAPNFLSHFFAMNDSAAADVIDDRAEIRPSSDEENGPDIPDDPPTYTA